MSFEELLDGPGGAPFGVVPDSIAMTEVSGALTGTTPTFDPDDTEIGTMPSWTLTGASTPVDGLTDGQSMTIFIDDGDAYSITWPTMTWVGGSVPELAVSGYTIVTLFKKGSTLYGIEIGDAA
jgi:hypothetical protein